MREDQDRPDGSDSTPWWEQPRPAYVPETVEWPPKLPPGASYGAKPGEIVYGPGGGPTFTGTNAPSQVTASPTTQTTTGGTSTTPTGAIGTFGSLTAPFTEGFTPPAQLGLPSTPQFHAPGYTPPPAFTAPSYADAQNDPGYQFTLGQGRQALEQGAAAKGVLNTGGTLKGLIDYGQAAGATQYQNVYDRSLNNYLTNYRTQFTDPYQFAFQNAQAQFAPELTGYQTTAAWNQRSNEDSYSNAFNKWLQDYNIDRNQKNDTWNKIFQYTTAQ